MSARVCDVAECDRVHYGRGYCKMHYARFIRNGTIERLPRRVPSLEEQILAKRERQKRYRNRHSVRIAQNWRAYKAANPEKVHDYGRKHNLARFGLTIADYEAMSEQQDALCAICGEPETVIVKGRASRLRVDHDHRTGTVRGLLCNTCNLHLGLLLEDPDWTRSAMDYLKGHGIALDPTPEQRIAKHTKDAA